MHAAVHIYRRCTHVPLTHNPNPNPNPYRLMYKHFHKYHHHHKAPEPFDDMFIHPLEAAAYYCILYSPPLLMRVHVYAFSLYMIILGVCGVLDHSGVKVCSRAECAFTTNYMSIEL